VADVYPKQIPDLFGVKPVIINGRYTAFHQGVIKLRGKMSGRDVVREIPVEFHDRQTQHDVIATLWARTRVDDLMSQDFNGAQQGNMREEVKQQIIQLGLDYRLMTQFTSFVAVEEMIVTDGGQPRRIDVPVEVPEGVNRGAVFGDEERPSGTLRQVFTGRRVSQLATVSANRAPTATVNVVTKSGTNAAKATSTPAPNSGGGGSGQGTGVGGGAPAPPKPAPAAGPTGLFSTYDGATLDAARKLSPEEQKRAQLQSRFHPAVLAVIDRLKDRKMKAGADEPKFIRDDKAEIQIWLTEKTDEAMAKLKELGFEVVLDPKTAKLVIGRLPIEKLAQLSELKFVRYVAPQIASN
jgi:hypothetical protein